VKTSHNYGVSPKYGVTQFHLQPDVSEHTPASKAGTRFTYPRGMKG